MDKGSFTPGRKSLHNGLLKPRILIYFLKLFANAYYLFVGTCYPYLIQIKIIFGFKTM